jgi:hypothetical protein
VSVGEVQVTPAGDEGGEGEATLRRWQLRRRACAVSGSLSERIAARSGGQSSKGAASRDF